MPYELGKSIVSFQNLLILNQTIHKDKASILGVYGFFKTSLVYIKLIKPVEQTVKEPHILFICMTHIDSQEFIIYY